MSSLILHTDNYGEGLHVNVIRSLLSFPPFLPFSILLLPPLHLSPPPHTSHSLHTSLSLYREWSRATNWWFWERVEQANLVSVHIYPTLSLYNVFQASECHISMNYKAIQSVTAIWQFNLLVQLGKILPHNVVQLKYIIGACMNVHMFQVTVQLLHVSYLYILYGVLLRVRPHAIYLIECNTCHYNIFLSRLCMDCGVCCSKPSISTPDALTRCSACLNYCPKH